MKNKTTLYTLEDENNNYYQYTSWIYNQNKEDYYDKVLIFNDSLIEAHKWKTKQGAQRAKNRLLKKVCPFTDKIQKHIYIINESKKYNILAVELVPMRNQNANKTI